MHLPQSTNMMDMLAWQTGLHVCCYCSWLCQVWLETSGATSGVLL